MCLTSCEGVTHIQPRRNKYKAELEETAALCQRTRLLRSAAPQSNCSVKDVKVARIHNIFWTEITLSRRWGMSLQENGGYSGIKVPNFLVYHQSACINVHKRHKCVEGSAVRRLIKWFALSLFWALVMSDFEPSLFFNWFLDTKLFQKNEKKQTSHKDKD